MSKPKEPQGRAHLADKVAAVAQARRKLSTLGLGPLSLDLSPSPKRAYSQVCFRSLADFKIPSLVQ